MLVGCQQPGAGSTHAGTTFLCRRDEFCLHGRQHDLLDGPLRSFTVTNEDSQSLAVFFASGAVHFAQMDERKCSDRLSNTKEKYWLKKEASWKDNK